MSLICRLVLTRWFRNIDSSRCPHVRVPGPDWVHSSVSSNFNVLESAQPETSPPIETKGSSQCCSHSLPHNNHTNASNTALAARLGSRDASVEPIWGHWRETHCWHHQSWAGSEREREPSIGLRAILKLGRHWNTIGQFHERSCCFTASMSDSGRNVAPAV